MRKKSSDTVFVVGVFFLSGFCGLIYEILWSRYLAELLGVTAMAQFVVLMVFMGGLALGALWIGRLIDRYQNGLLYYALLELGIGLYAIFFTFMFSQVEEFYYWSAGDFTPDTSAFFVYRFFVASLLIVVPSVAMGGTLPAVVHYLNSQRRGVRENMSLLYGTNTLGGVLGGLVAGFFMIHHFGLATSMVSVGSLNVSLGLLALGVVWVSRCREKKQANDVPGGRSVLADEVVDSQVYSQEAAGRALFAAGFAGFAAMALQMAWIRYFSLVLGNTHSAFTIVVTAFILGLGLGALVARSKVVASISLPLFLTLSFALTATAIGWGLFFYVRVPFELSRLMGTIEHAAHSWAFHEIVIFFFCFVLMALPTIASGMILPICTRIVSGGKDSVGRDVAKVYVVNTLGCLLGIGVTSQLLFRMLSLPRTLQFIFFIYVAATTFLLFVLKEEGRKRMAALIVVLLVVHVGFWRPWSPEELHLKHLQFGEIGHIQFADFKVMNEQAVVVVSSQQGPNVQVTVEDIIIDDISCRSMFINGKADASACDGTDSDMENQVFAGHLPMLLHEKPNKVFVLGLGSGVTTGEVLKFPEVKQVVTAELAGEVFEASKFFAKYNNRFWEDPRSSLVIEDGKTFLQLSNEKFDVLIVQPTNINEHGMSGLYTEEFFRLAKSRMASGGMLAQWLQLYKLDDQTINIVIKTFSRVFPRASIFMTDQQSVLLIGYDERWHFNPAQLAQRFNQPMILATQRQYGNDNPSVLLLREIMSRDAFQRYASVLTAPINTMDFPILEKAAEYAYFIDPPLAFLQEQDSRFNIERENLLIHDLFQEVDLDPPQLQEVIASRLLEHQPKLKRSFLFLLLGQIWAGDQPTPPAEVLDQIFDGDLRQIIMHPYYRLVPEQMTPADAGGMLWAELQLWEKTSSQFWTPEPKRLRQLYDRYATEVDQQEGGEVARNIAFFLASRGGYKAALPYLQLAEVKGQLMPEKLQENDLALAFACEVQAGTPVKAYRWWQEIEQRRCEVSPAIQSQKIALDLKLVGMRELSLTAL